MAKFNKYLKDSWNELNKWYRQGKIYPEQENDITCFLYHKLAEKGVRPGNIKTERSINTYKKGHRIRSYRADVYIENKFFMEMKMYPMVKGMRSATFSDNISSLRELSIKMSDYVKREKTNRVPIIAVWWWGRDEREKIFLKKEFIAMLECLRSEIWKKRKIKLLYGPVKE